MSNVSNNVTEKAKLLEKLNDLSNFNTLGELKNYFNLPNNGQTTRIIKEYINIHNLSIVHFDYGKSKRKYVTITKNCPVCNKEFQTKQNHKREKITCSHSCSNTHFRSKENHPNWNSDADNKYRDIRFKDHKKECIICGESVIVAVHHYDCNHNNNSPENLIPICPTHHCYIHSNYNYLIQNKVDEYYNNFIKTYKSV